MYIIIRSFKGGWEYHSCHTTRSVADEWVRCLLHDGKSDFSIVECSMDAMTDIKEFLEDK